MRRIYQTGGNFGSPKLDLAGCVLYVPLWRPDLAGNSFKSKGPYGIPIHTCTVTGAVWGLQGRTFDGTNDYISFGNNAILNFTTQDFTLISWIKPDLSGAVDAFHIFSRSPNPLISGYRLWYQNDDKIVHFNTYQAADGQETTSTGALTDAEWQQIVVIRAGAVVNIYRNLVDITNVSGTHIDPDTSTANFTMGIHPDGVNYSYAGIFGEGEVYNRALTAVDVAHNWQSTKWRYQ